MDNLESGHVPQNEAEVDALLSEVHQPAPVPEAVLPVNTVITPQATPTAPQAATQPMITINWKGEQKTLPQDKVVALAQQAYDYSQKMQQYNQQQTAFQTQQQQVNDLMTKYKGIDDYAVANPEWFDKVQAAHVKATQQAPSANGQDIMNHPVVQQLQTQVGEMSQMVGEWKAQQERDRQAADDAALDAAITEYREANPGLNWDETDPLSGISLSDRVIDHAANNGIGSFQAAANDLLRDQLIQLAVQQGKTAVGQSIQETHRLGLGPVTPSPTQGLIGGAENVGAKSYEDLANEAILEVQAGTI